MTWVTAFPFFLEFGYEATFKILNTTGKRERGGEKRKKQEPKQNKKRMLGLVVVGGCI